MNSATPAGTYLPVGLDVRGKLCLVVGGGQVGYRKAQDLLAAGAVVKVVSPQFADEFKAAGDELLLLQKPFTPADLSGVFLVVAAAGDEKVNQQVYEQARNLGVLVNVVDDAARSDFIFPAVLSRGQFQIAVLTGGASPSLGQRVRDRLAEEFGTEYGEWAARLAEARPRVKRSVPDPRDRRQVFAALADEEVLAALRSRGPAGFEEKLAMLLGRYGRLRVGTRGSALALAQAETAARVLAAHGIGAGSEPVVIKTSGDRGARFDTTGIFVREIENALLADEIDLAVHSLKDLPVAMPAGLCLAAVLPRDDPRDVLVSRDGKGLYALPTGARVGTSSVRRRAELKSIRPDLEVVELRGNVDTRLRKLAAGEVDAVVLAGAALVRLGWQDRITEWLPLRDFVPAPGQGALAIEARAGWETLFSAVDDRPTRTAVEAERACLSALGGGCSLPLGVYGSVSGNVLYLQGLVASPDGNAVIRAEVAGEASQPRVVGELLAARLRAAGADAVLAGTARQAGKNGQE